MEIPAEPNTQSDLSVCATVTTITKSVVCFSFLIGACERLFFFSFIYHFFLYLLLFRFSNEFCMCRVWCTIQRSGSFIFTFSIGWVCAMLIFFSIFTFDFLFHFDVHCILLKMLTRFPLSRICDSVELYEVIRLRIMAKCTQYALALKKHL